MKISWYLRNVDLSLMDLRDETVKGSWGVETCNILGTKERKENYEMGERNQ